ncbi:MAG: class I SAM-dependent methyltransferase, partial [Pseudomonadota bacterium]
MTDHETLAVYDAKIEDYKAITIGEPSQALLGFMADLPKGGTVLDLGCGPGFAAAVLADHGFVATATDASPEMAKSAGSHRGVTARCEDFSQLPHAPTYDGIYANFSLLHVTRDAFAPLIHD